MKIKPLQDVEVSYYDNVFNNSSKGQKIGLLEVLEGIRLGVWRNEVGLVRNAVRPEDKKKHKSALPAITVSGIFSPPRCDESLLEFSGRIAIDLDNTSEQDVEKLKHDKHTESLFKSCSGNGHALITRLEIDNKSGNVNARLFSEAYKKVLSYYKKLSFNPDESCKNISRLRYVTHDAAIVINKQSESFCFDSKELSLDDKTDSVAAIANLYAKGNRDNSLFALAAKLLAGGASNSFVFGTIKEIVNGWRGTDKETAEKGVELDNFIKKKIYNAAQSLNKDLGLIAQNIKRWITEDLKDGQLFRLDNVFSSFGVHSQESRVYVRELLKDFAREGLIVHDSRTAESYKRKAVETLTPMRINSSVLSSNKGVTLILPLDINKHAAIMPKNVVVVAGAKSSGKSAFALTVAHLNLNKGKKIRYFSSEMADVEMCHRLKSFVTSSGESVDMSFWENACKNEMEFFYKSSGFADYILPDGINIVDFLEVHDTFYGVAKTIAEMYDKLNTGILLICIQKSFRQRLGRGAEFSLEKARLYITLDWDMAEKCGVARIVDAKFPIDAQNPARGLMRKYRLISGSYFYPITSWEQESFDDE